MAAEHWPLLLFVFLLIGICGLCIADVLWGPVAAQPPSTSDPGWLELYQRKALVAARDEDFIDAMRDRDSTFPDPLPMENRLFLEYLVPAHDGYMAALKQFGRDLDD